VIFDAVDRFIVGTVGQPGERAFYLQVRQVGQLATIAVEKSQVAALTSRLEMLLAQLRKNGHTSPMNLVTRDDAPLEQPIDPDFVVGAISLSWNEESKLIEIELLDVEETPEELSWNLFLPLDMAHSFVKRANAVINSGRLPCPFCGLAIDPQGHLCPRSNGYRR